jgi:Poly(hydroxyalcanoate) granule associated protein (phasin)
MKTTTRKIAPKLPFHVPAPVEKALKTAGSRFDAFSVKARSVAGKVGGDVQDRVQKARAEAARRAEGVAKNVTETVGTAVEKGLHSLNVPTRKELRSLSAKVDGLGKKIDALKTRKVTRAKRSAR